MSNQPKRTEFEIAATFLGLTQQEQDATLALMAKLKIGLNDLNAVPIVTAVKLGGQVTRFGDEFNSNARSLAAQIRSGVGAELHKELANAPAILAAKMEESMKGLEERIATNVDTMADKRAAKRDTIKVSQIGTGVAVAMFLACAAGYVVGKDAINAQAARLEAFASRSDSAAFMKLATYNDFNRVMAECSATGQFELKGAPACKPNILLGATLNSSDGFASILLIWTRLTVAIGSLGLLAAGLVVGFFGGRWFGNSK